MKSFYYSIAFLVLFFTGLFLFDSSTTSHNGTAVEVSSPVENFVQTQKQAESIQKNIVLPEKKQSQAAPSNNFKSFAQNALEKLPRNDEARLGVEKNSHDTPEAIMKAGATIGYVADQMKADRRNVETGLRFFKSCAEGSNISSTIRAVCLRNLVDFSSRYKNNVRVSFADYPEDIQRIARHIPRLR